MTSFAQIITTILGLGTIVMNILTVLLIIGSVTKNSLARFFGKYVLETGFIVSVGAFGASLLYSNIIGFEACTFCWWQRIFIYPQAILFAVMLYYKHRQNVTDYRVGLMTSLIMSIIGGALALFQYYSQILNPALLEACGATGASCTKLFFVSFGYITIPMMSLACFALLIVTVISYYRTHA